MRFIKIIIVVCCVFVDGFCFGQIDKQILFDQIHIPGVIVQNPINDIIQDHNGLMWFCTNDGIHRYDGYQFETFRPDSTDQILGFNKILQKNDSTLLVGTVTNGLFKFNYFSHSFISIPLPGITNNSIENIVLDKNNNIWLNCLHGGLYQYRHDSLLLVNNDTISAMAISAGGHLQYASNNLLKELKDGEVKIIGQLPRGHVITSIGYNGSNIWLGTLNDGLFEIGARGLVKLLDLHLSQVNAIFQDKDLNMWVLTHNSGIFLFHRGEYKQLNREFYNNKSLISDRTLSICQDKNDIIWIGTGTGINTYDPYKNKFEVYRHDPLNESSISSDIIRGIYEDQSGNIWIGTEDGSINILDSAKKKFKHKKLSLPGQPKIIPYDFFELNAKEMLVATSHGILLVSKDLKSIRPHPTITQKALNSSRARTIVPYLNHNLMILAEGSVFFYDIKKDQLDKLKIINGKPNLYEQSVDNFARTIYVDDQNTVWIASYGSIARVDINSQSAEYYTFADNRGPMVMYMQKLGDKLWVGTFNGGLLRFDIPTHQFKSYTTKNGLPNNSVYTAIPDNHNHLWISCNEGLSKFSLDNESFENFDINDGLQGQEFNRLAYCVRANGEIVLGGINGLNIFHPDHVKMNPHSPTSIILNTELLNEFEEGDPELHPKISLIGKNQIELSYKQNFLRFNFCSTHFSSPGENKFYYQLENFDENWIYAGAKNIATYTGLKHGEYVFKVKSVSPDGLEEPQYASVMINIEAPFWMSWWFYASIVLIVALIGYTAINRRIAQNKAAQLLLEKEITRRTQQLKQSKDELSDLNEKKDFIFSILSHDLRAPLTTLEGFLGLIINHYDQMQPEEIQAHAIAIKNSVGKSLDLIDNTLYWSLSQMGNITYNPIDVKISSLFDRVKGLYELTAQKKNIKLEFEADPELTLYVDDNMAYIIIRNLVSNAIKFSPHYKEIKVHANLLDNMVVITVADQGAGISPEHMEKLFDQKPNLSKRGTSNEKGAGLGLILCKKFIDTNKGMISAKSNSSGSVFEIRFPASTTA